MVKPCSKCLVSLPATDFYADARNVDGLYSACKRCVLVHRAATHDPVKRRGAALLRKYGLSGEAYGALYVAQAGCCAICGRHESVRALCVDHDHVTGVVRGLLCGRCNRGIGLLDDGAAGVALAVAYLSR